MLTNCNDAVSALRVALIPDVDAIRRTIAEIRPDLGPTDATFRAAMLLLVGPATNFNVDRLAARTQCPRPMVAASARRLFDNGVWEPDGPVYAWVSPDDNRFWWDVAVAEGQLCRRTDALGQITWAAPGKWRKAYDFVQKEKDSTQLAVAYVSQPEPAPEIFERRQPEAVTPEPVAQKPQPPAVVTNLPGLLPSIPTRIERLIPLQPAQATEERGNLFPDAVWLA
jgi:hypothetical protein